MCYIHTDQGILLSHEMGWSNAICSNMDGPRGYHTKWRKSEREGQIPYSITYMWNLKYDTNEPIFKQTYIENLWLKTLFRWIEITSLNIWKVDMIIDLSSSVNIEDIFLNIPNTPRHFPATHICNSLKPSLTHFFMY